MQPERDRGPGIAARASADQQLASTPNTSDRTPALGRLTWNGHPGLVTTFARRRGWFDPELERLLRDHEAAALAIFDVIGRQRVRHLAHRLLELAEEVA